VCSRSFFNCWTTTDMYFIGAPVRIIEDPRRCSLVYQPQPFDLRLECPAGTRAGFAKATVRIRDIGKLWLGNWPKRNVRRVPPGH
jgi:hypothetical protein